MSTIKSQLNINILIIKQITLHDSTTILREKSK
jgi:hypothetical protein